MYLKEKVETLCDRFLSERFKDKFERIVLTVAIISFLIHLLFSACIQFNIIAFENPSKLLSNPIAAIYTPFSFILVYEVYLSIYFLPKSFSNYISKQYEIIALIIIRRMFKDFSDLSLTTDWFSNKGDLQFTFDLVASVLLFFLIYTFQKQLKVKQGPRNKVKTDSSNLGKFIVSKKWIAAALLPILFFIAIYSFIDWSFGIIWPESEHVSFKNINNIFFEHFFGILIISEVLILLFSFFNTDKFHVVIRNSGFVISTILIRISFSVSGIMNTLLIVTAVLFGVLMLVIHNKFEKMLFNENEIINSNTPK
jgi:hypothetical protein